MSYLDKGGYKMGLKVKDLVETYKMDVLTGDSGLDRLIEKSQITRPGLELAGMFDFYEDDRLQLVGSKEIAFFWWLNEKDQDIRVDMLFEKRPPAFLFSKNVDVPQVFIDKGKKYDVPVIKSKLKSSELFSSVYNYLYSALAERIGVHGTLVDINGIGVLIRGKSGIGKSEVALELVRRGHQLVADDRVDIYEREIGMLIGEAPKVLRKYLEIRGIGIVNVVKLFGASAYKDNKKIMLIVELIPFDLQTDHDRLGLDDVTEQIFETKVPLVKIPITAARSVPSLIEVAAMNTRLKFLGINMAHEFTDELTVMMDENKNKNKK